MPIVKVHIKEAIFGGFVSWAIFPPVSSNLNLTALPCAPHLATCSLTRADRSSS